jgi:hypothetical protein
MESKAGRAARSKPEALIKLIYGSKLDGDLEKSPQKLGAGLWNRGLRSLYDFAYGTVG